jgi:hypothetical protein
MPAASSRDLMTARRATPRWFFDIIAPPPFLGSPIVNRLPHTPGGNKTRRESEKSCRPRNGAWEEPECPTGCRYRCPRKLDASTLQPLLPAPDFASAQSGLLVESPAMKTHRTIANA